MLVKGITKIYHNKNKRVEALKDVSFELSNNGLYMILGPSGSGKTTLINILSGQDRKYIGKIIGNEVVEIIDQEIMLFENMTVQENLLFVNRDINRITKLLEQFHLLKYITCKIKNLSQGQKKRIQIIRSLLQNPDILLCDEPTASLDQDSSKIVMNMLKQLSHRCIVVVVTHKENYVNRYADRVIEMDKGEIINNKCINDTQPHNCVNKHAVEKKTFLDHMYYIFLNYKSRKMYCIFNIFVVFCILFGAIFSYNMIHSTQANIDKNIFTYYNQNIINAAPNDYNNENSIQTFDTFQYTDIQTIINSTPEIIGYTFSNDNRMYSYCNETTEVCRSDITRGKEIEKDGMVFQLIPHLPYVELVNYDDTKQYNDSGMSLVYQITDSMNLDLSYGHMPTQDNEMVIDKNVAQLLCHIYNIQTFEELLGKTFTLYWNDIYYGELDSPSHEFEISGIMNVNSVYENQIFVKADAWFKVLCDTFHIDKEQWYFDSVSFMLDPLCDIDIVIDHMNNIYTGKNCHFEVKDFQNIENYCYREISGRYSDVKPVFEISQLFNVFIIFIVFFLIFYVLLDFINIRNRKKEIYLLKKYNYRYQFLGVFMIFVIIVISMILTMLFGHMICLWISDFIKVFFSDYDFSNFIIEFNFFDNLIIIVVIGAIMMIKEVLMNGYATQKYR